MENNNNKIPRKNIFFTTKPIRWFQFEEKEDRKLKDLAKKMKGKLTK